MSTQVVGSLFRRRPQLLRLAYLKYHSERCRGLLLRGLRDMFRKGR